jgi:hypothetical protein
MKKIYFIIIPVAFLASCDKSNDPPVQLSSEKNVSGVVFKSVDNPSLPGDVTATITTDSIKVQLLQNIAVNNLIPTINFAGKTISPANHTAQNFTSPITYTVTAEDGTTKSYSFKISRVDSSTFITGRWHIIKDSLFDTPNFVNSGGGHPTPGVYIGTAADYWEFYANGFLDVHENNNSFNGIHYQVLPNNRLSVAGLDIDYDPATIETLTPNSAIFSWSKTLSNGERYFRRIFLSR